MGVTVTWLYPEREWEHILLDLEGWAKQYHIALDSLVTGVADEDGWIIVEARRLP